MPIKRTKAKARSHRLTLEAVEAFHAAEQHQELYSACIASGTCRRPEPNRHCDECRMYIEASQALDRSLGLKPWEASPLDATQDVALRDGTAWAESFEQAQALRAELLNWERD